MRNNNNGGTSIVVLLLVLLVGFALGGGLGPRDSSNAAPQVQLPTNQLMPEQVQQLIPQVVAPVYDTFQQALPLEQFVQPEYQGPPLGQMVIPQTVPSYQGQNDINQVWQSTQETIEKAIAVPVELLGSGFDFDTVGSDQNGGEVGRVYRTVQDSANSRFQTFELPAGVEPLKVQDFFSNQQAAGVIPTNDPANNCSFTDRQSWMDAGLPAECWVEPFTPASQLGIDFCSPNRCGNYACGCATAQP